MESSFYFAETPEAVAGRRLLKARIKTEDKESKLPMCNDHQVHTALCYTM